MTIGQLVRRVLLVDEDGNAIVPGSGLVPEAHDYIDCSYTTGLLTGVVYKTGGSGGTTVATLALTYDGSDNLDTITKT